VTDDPVPRLSPLLEAVLSVGTVLELRTTLQHIVDGAADLTGARYAALGTTDRARALADAAAGVILQPTEAGGMEIVTASI
jgi:hypothetical protein